MDDLIGDFQVFLPRLVGAVVVFVVGVALVLAPPTLLVRWWIRRSEPADIAKRVVMGALFVWVAMAGLVILSLTINVLAIDPLQRVFDDLLSLVPSVVVALLVAVAGWFLFLHLPIRWFFRSLETPSEQRPGWWTVAAVGTWVWASLIGFLVLTVILDTLAINLPLLPSLYPGPA